MTLHRKKQEADDTQHKLLRGGLRRWYSASGKYIRTGQTLINKGFELAEEVAQKELGNPKKHNNEKPLAYVTTYNKNNPKLFTEITENLELKNNDNIKKILDTTKVIKSQRQPKNL